LLKWSPPQNMPLPGTKPPNNPLPFNPIYVYFIQTNFIRKTRGIDSMYPLLIHLYGPIAIYSYGTAIAIGIALSVFLATQDKKQALIISTKKFYDVIGLSTIAGIFGGHVLYWLEEDCCSWGSLFSFWNGLSLLGAVIGIILFLIYYLPRINVPILPFFDLVAVYAPLAQCFGRIGCFLAGCCYGRPTTLPWAITYTDPAVTAPIGISLHPTQLYSAFLLLLIFFIMRFALRDRLQKPGQLTAVYLILTNGERIITDFFRTDHDPLYQLLALALVLSGIGLFYWATTNKRKIGS
jgi:phosphatidylglycerol:prolipoprotein diacylglycerol transferase